MILSGNGDASWVIAGALLAFVGYGRAGMGIYAQARRAELPWGSLLIASVALVVLWHLQAGTLPGLSLHLLGAMLCTLVLGAPLATVPLTIALVSTCLSSGAAWQVFGINACLMVFWPIIMSRMLSHLLQRLPANIFVFIFVGGFFASGTVVLLTGWLLTLVLWAMQIYPWNSLLEDFASYWLLVAFSEAWISGMLLTILVIYRPERVALFDAVRYIDRA